MQGPSKPEWDTPPDGDFANYVERLSRPPSVQRPSEAMPIEPKDGGVSTVASSAGLPPDLAQVLAPFQGLLKLVRALLLLFAVVQGAAFLVWGKGTLVGVAVAGVLWWVLGSLSSRAFAKLTSEIQGPGKPSMAQLQERLAQLAKQRTTESKESKK
jgi:hypothetical protein